MTSRPHRTQIRRWAALVAALVCALIGVILVDNTGAVDLLGIALVVAGVVIAFVTTPPEVR